MRTVLKYLSAACAGTVLLACAVPGQRDPVGVPLSAEDSYLIARSHHMALRVEQARASYMQALAAAPQHVAARNGLAALYAEQGLLGKAIAMWEQVTDDVVKSDSYLLSNLGYAYLLNGDLDKSRATLERACVLDPLNSRAWEHLGRALAQLGQRDRADAMAHQAATLRGHDLRSDYSLIDGMTTPLREVARTEIEQTPGGMFIMRRVEAPVLIAASVDTEVVRTRARLEIRNGNGVNGMARSVARSMGTQDPLVVRLGNVKGFGVQQSRIEYRAGFRNAAHQLGMQVGTARLVPSTTSGGVDLRLIIGRDLAQAAAAHDGRLDNAGRFVWSTSNPDQRFRRQ